MKIETRTVTEDGLIQITTSDERWYKKTVKNKSKEETIFVPSNTWVCSFYPKGKGFEEWLKKNGEEAENLKKEAGNKGSKVHQAIEDLLRGVEVKIDAKYVNHDSGREEELTVEEYGIVMSFVTFYLELTKKHTIKILGIEETIWNTEIGVAGTLDLRILVDNKEVWVIDHKTSANIYKSHELQLTFLKRTTNADRGFILQLGYKRNADKYKLTEVRDCWSLYLATKQIWEAETASIFPLQKDYPLSLKLDIEQEENE